MVPTGHAPPEFVRLAAHPLRWQLLTELARSDYRVRELIGRLGQPQSLISYHLRLLRGSGLVTTRRSSFDGRDSYYHLDLERCAAALAVAGIALHPALRLEAVAPSTAFKGSARPSVLFACTGNSARSPIAAALLRHRAGGRMDVFSAGSHPKPRMHPNAVRVMRERFGVDIADQRPVALDTLAHHRFDHVISVCDKVREVRSEFRDQPRLIHWSIPDPTGDGVDDQASYPAFERAAAEIDTRIRYLLPMLVHSTILETRP